LPVKNAFLLRARQAALWAASLSGEDNDDEAYLDESRECVLSLADAALRLPAMRPV
jgi:hypothetical protein